MTDVDAPRKGRRDRPTRWVVDPGHPPDAGISARTGLRQGAAAMSVPTANNYGEEEERR